MPKPTLGVSLYKYTSGDANSATTTGKNICNRQE